MPIAWTTILVIVLLLPGLFFFLGLATFERLSREIVRSSAISEIGLAVTVAITIHLIMVSVLSGFGFRFSEFIEPLFGYDRLGTNILVQRVTERLGPAIIYVIVTASLGGGLGALVAWGIMSGPLRFLATHKWIYDVIDANRKGRVVTAYILTNISQNNKILMYRGRLQEFFLSPNGAMSYVVLRNCASFYMTFADAFPETTKQLNLFGAGKTNQPIATWAYLMIEGPNIANILFDSSPEIKETDEGTAALDEAIKTIVASMQAGRTARNNLPKPNATAE